MMRKKKLKARGFHIARSIVNPSTTYLGESGGFVSFTKALLFLDHNQARDYAKSIELEVGDIRNVIVPCECPEHVRDNHPIAGEYY